MRKKRFTVTATVKMTPETWENLDKVAEVKQMAISELIRNILEDYLK